MGVAAACGAPSTRRRLILCLDGTWNDDRGLAITNVVRLRDMIQPGILDQGDGSAPVEQRIYYDPGVGTGSDTVEKLLGGSLGLGLGTNVRQAYRFLCQFYEPGDEILVFGFSRGAFTARSLAGYIGASGLLQRDHCTPELEARSWANYRTDPKNRFPAEGVALSAFCHDEVKVALLGVFDTVGTLGIPLEYLNAIGRSRFRFHDTRLSSAVSVSLQALAVDEKRSAFPPALWERPFHANNKVVEQVWFPGVHSDIGGGYEDGGVGAATLRWMLDRIDALGSEHGFRLVLRPGAVDTLKPDPAAKIHESRTGLLYARDRSRPQIRVIAQQRPKDPGEVRLAALAPHARPINEYVHLGVLRRMAKGLDEDGKPYAPLNMQWLLDALFPSNDPVEERPPIQVGFIDDRGRWLDWIGDEAAFDELVDALPERYHAAAKRERAMLRRQRPSQRPDILGGTPPMAPVPADTPETPPS
ncbi:DUF2235 domain-containing protein [Ancylobacter sp. 6x-1]|uniref:DUF2235 domain-containing protein n=1 Tax=Ancylobacter crimeensis TaxID=2579147 RepID=A0ABT0DEX4_9HYPH|nr:DUF2235 domain-containing protein [Ancylobacter crimeensis]MCK0198502.1 DUF2235 domain-containing protein [Ancylobacter crimeensis]